MGSIRDCIEEYVKNQLKYYRPQRIRAPKVIHDTILGSNLFYPHEIVVLDLPILQRLRKISQVDVVSLVFPSGNHNRFEHTLGVAVIAEKLAKAIKPGDLLSGVITNEQIQHLRMAAILHDCGHGPFSHISEEIYKHCGDLLTEIKENPRLKGSNPHEALSYLIVISQSFRKFFLEHIDKEYGTQFDLDLIGDMIVGYVEDPKKAYLIDIINGAFDADKLDYIQRDSHFTGIKMVLDLERLFHTMEIIQDKGGRFRLSVDITGVS
ncbi:MAG: HD domain-containing protein [Bacillota bacterium]